MRLIQQYQHNDRVVKVHWNSQLQEYKVSLFRAGKHYEPGDYFTDDKSDALASGQLMVRDASSSDIL